MVEEGQHTLDVNRLGNNSASTIVLCFTTARTDDALTQPRKLVVMPPRAIGHAPAN